jgi:hypothetical protein
MGVWTVWSCRLFGHIWIDMFDGHSLCSRCDVTTRNGWPPMPHPLPPPPEPTREPVVLNGVEFVHRGVLCRSNTCPTCEIVRLRRQVSELSAEVQAATSSDSE